MVYALPMPAMLWPNVKHRQTHRQCLRCVSLRLQCQYTNYSSGHLAKREMEWFRMFLQNPETTVGSLGEGRDSPRTRGICARDEQSMLSIVMVFHMLQQAGKCSTSPCGLTSLQNSQQRVTNLVYKSTTKRTHASIVGDKEPPRRMHL